ncbi:MAG: tetratricopeptide repeat protein [Alphaproteobacteria bacterium]|nr:tetratricopeptide repeat protein [Alphaproteobacteria bacterium]
MSLAAAQSKDDFLPAPLRAVAPYFVLALVVFAAYGNIFDNVFLFDDDLLILSNSYLHGWGHLGDLLKGSTTSGVHIEGGFYRPVQMLLYLLVFHLGDGSTFWFHLLNLSLHVANTCFVYRLGIKLGFRPWGVFLAALVWGLHPLHTEAVTYMSGTADPLFAFFCLWAVISVLPDVTLCKILKIIPLFLLGLGSKETAIVLPLLLMTCMFLTNQRRLDFHTYWPTWPLWCISILYTVWRLHAEGFVGPQHTAEFNALHNYDNLALYADSPIYRVYTFLATLPAYLKLLALPGGLHMERAFLLYTTAWSVSVMAGLGLVVLAVMQIIHSSKKPNLGIEMSWGVLWFASAHVPDSGILIPVNAIYLEHWMYLPSVGLFLGVGETAAKLLQSRSRSSVFACSAIVLSFAGVLSVKTYNQNVIWHDPVSFYGNIFKYGERSERAHNNLALYYMHEGDYDDALEQFNQALAISDTYARTRYNIAVTYLHMPDQSAHIPEAIQSLNRAIELDPKFYRSYQLLGDIYDSLGDKDKTKYYNDYAETLLKQSQ